MFAHNLRSAKNLRFRLIGALTLALLLMMMTPAVFAQDSAPAEDEAPSEEAAPAEADGAGNDGSLEFGVWWVEDYDPAGAGGSDLPATRPDALGLRNYLTSTCKFSLFGICFTYWPTPTWTPRFVYGNSNAWSTDWRRSQNGGSENFYIDTIDLAYFAGHGSSGGILFGANSPTPRTVTKNDALAAWGTADADWLGLAACNVLDDPISNLQDWGSAMNGVRLILGFKTVMNDVPHGEEFGRYIRDGYSFTQAWFKAADKLQSQNRVARVLAEDSPYFDDTWVRHNAFTAVNWPKYYRTHTVGSEPARYVDAAQIDMEMPVLAVEPLSLDEAAAQLNTLGTAFGVTITLPATGTQSAGIQQILENGGVAYSEDGQLEMDLNYGLFLSADKGNLWKTDSEMARQARAGVAMQAISSDEARALADSFLQQHGLNRADAQFYEVAADTLSTLDETVSASGERSVSVVAEDITNYQVIYSRIISYTPTLGNGRAATETVEFSVMGPGSKAKVYVAAQVPEGVSGASSHNEGILGGMGGYRQIQTPVEAAEAGALQMVTMLPFAKIAKLFETLEPIVALDHVPLAPSELKSREIVTYTAAYWEGAIGFEQTELIPVYAIEVRNTLQDNSVVSSTTYIPVAAAYMAPLAQISTTVDLDATVTPGQLIALEAYDASKTLGELGLDPDPDDGNPLDFVLGSGDVSYAWYVDVVSDATRIGNGRSIVYAVNLSLGVDAKDGNSGVHRIVLEVTDNGKDSEPRTSQAVITLNAVSPVFLPEIQNQ
jgi:hypothetical protein